MTDHSAHSQPKSSLDVDDGPVEAGLLIMLMFALIVAFVASLGLGPYVLAMAAGAWIQKKFS